MQKIYVKTRLLVSATLCCLLFVSTASAAIHPFLATYSGRLENPANPSPAIATIAGIYDDANHSLYYIIVFGGLSSGTSAAHFHAPGAPGVNAPVVINHAGFPVGITAGTYTAIEVLTDEQEAQLKAGLWYSNIHTANYPAGEVRAQIVLGIPDNLRAFRSTYSGKQEVPPNNSMGTGTILGIYDVSANRIYYGILFAGLSGTTTAAHFHAPGAPGVNAPVVVPLHGFPTGDRAGWYANTHLLTDEQESQLLKGLWYSNIHTTQYPDGEIRAQLMPKEQPPTQPDTSCITITGLSASPCVLWPPNHKMKDVKVDYMAGDSCGSFAGCSLSVTSNEPVDGVGDSNTSPDWLVINDHLVQLRAERAGNGNGRVYTIKVTCKDSAGRTVSKTTMVKVPHNRSRDNMGDCPASQQEPGLHATISNNPGRGSFMLNIQTDNDADRITVKISNLQGRIVSTINNLFGSQVIRIGDNLGAGIFFVKITQGHESIQLKLVILH